MIRSKYYTETQYFVKGNPQHQVFFNKIGRNLKNPTVSS